jgi:hypothetical protein
MGASGLSFTSVGLFLKQLKEAKPRASRSALSAASSSTFGGSLKEKWLVRSNANWSAARELGEGAKRNASPELSGYFTQVRT